MKKQSKILSKLYDFAVGILFFATTVGAVVFLSVTLLSGFFNPFEVILGLAGILLLAYSSIIVHEAGHLIFGLMSGYGFSSFRIGSLMWVKQDGKIRLRRFSLAGTGGQCLMVPKGESESRAQLITFNLGGVYANVILSCLFGLLYFLSLRVILLALIFLFGAIVSFFVAITNGIPIALGGIANDGMNALHLSKNPDAAIAFRNQLLMNAAQTNGTSLEQMPDEWFELPEGADMQNVHCASIAVFRANRCFATQDMLTAENEIIRVLHSGYNIIGLHRSLLTLDLIYCRLVNDSDADISSLLTPELKKIVHAMRTFPAVIRTEYAIALLAENDENKAAKILEEFDKKTKNYPYQQDAAFERELILKALEIRKNKI